MGRKRVAKVFHKERLPPALARFVAWWEVNGGFDLTVPPSGGARTDADQRVEWAKGRRVVGAPEVPEGWSIVGDVVTKSFFGRDSAHGHLGAGDFLPVRSYFGNGMPANVYLAGANEDREVRAEGIRRMTVVGKAAKALGYEWGGDFPGFFDGPHIQVPEWRTLPLGPGVAAG